MIMIFHAISCVNYIVDNMKRLNFENHMKFCREINIDTTKLYDSFRFLYSAKIHVECREKYSVIQVTRPQENLYFSTFPHHITRHQAVKKEFPHHAYNSPTTYCEQYTVGLIAGGNVEKIHLAANHRPSSVVLYEDQKFTQTRGPAGSRLQVAGESGKGTFKCQSSSIYIHLH